MACAEELRPAIWLAAAQLEHHDPNVRTAAIQAVEALASEQAVVAASARLDHKTWAVRGASLEAASRAAQHGDSRVVAAACEALCDPEVQIRRIAVAALVRVARPGDHAAVVALIGRLEDPDPGLRTEAIKAIAGLRIPGDTEVTARLSALLEHGTWYVRNAAVEALAAACKGDPWAADASAARLGMPYRGVRTAAGEALVSVATSNEDQHATACVLPFLKHSEWSVCANAAEIIPRIASKDDVNVVEAVAALLEDSQCDSAKVVEVLSVFRCRHQVLTTVANRLKSEKWFVRRSALHALVCLEATPKEAEDILVPLQKEKLDEAAYQAIEDALEQLLSGRGAKHGIATAGYQATGRPSFFPVAKDNHGLLRNRSIRY
jgi:HEAT repeat protein